MYRNVMVPVDGSSFSREAVLQGLRIASRCGATLRLVRVAAAPIALTTSEGIEIESEGLRQLHASALADLYAIAVECRAHSTVNVTASLQHGPIADAIIGYAKRHRVDLIVMRSHARRGLARVWLGSTADRLIRDSGIPVLVVRPPSMATGLENGIQFKRILVPVDGSKLAEQSLASAVSLARIDGATLTLVRVVPPSRREIGVLESDIGPASADDVTAATRYLDSLLTADTDRTLSVTRRVVVSDDVPATIMQMADTGEVDLIAIATRGRNAFARATGGSVADHIMRESITSVMVLHPTDTRAEAGDSSLEPSALGSQQRSTETVGPSSR